MKKQLFSVLVLGVCLIPVLSSMKSNSVTAKAHRISAVKSFKKGLFTEYYLGDTDNGATGAYAVYGTSSGVGATINEVMQYSTGTYFTATGYTYTKIVFCGNLTASNGYNWNGPLTQ